MFGDVWKWAGKPREKNVSMGTAQGSPPQQIELLMTELLACLPYWEGTPLVEQAAMLHHRAVLIHPFNNGNGRWSRLLANIWLRLHKQPYPRWPEEDIGGGESPIRKEYIRAIEAADQGEYGALMGLHVKYAKHS
jgi:Fic family protein